MAVTADQPETSKLYASLACEYGNHEACGLLGEILFLEAKASTVASEAARRFSMTHDLLEPLCDQDDWRACFRAAYAGMRAGGRAAPAQVDQLTKMGTQLAEAACEKEDAYACEFLAEAAREVGDTQTAKAKFGRACRLLLAAVDSDRRVEMTTDPTCAASKELGNSLPDLVALEELTGGIESRPMTSEEVAKLRYSGETDIHPSRRVREFMVGNGIPQLFATFRIYLDDLGLPSKIYLLRSSGAVSYDVKLLERIRTWRYEPHIEAGSPTPICTTVTFVYRQPR